VPPVAPTLPPVQTVAGGEAVAFQSADGAVTMRGALFAAPGPKRKALVIASQLPDMEAGWQPFAKELAGAGIATLTFQMPQYADVGGTQRDFVHMDRDLESAVLLLESRDFPLIYVLGDNTAGVGALKLAARRKVAGIITVAAPISVGSPGRYDARADLAKLSMPKLFIGPQSGPDTTQELMKAPEPKQSKLFAGLPGAVAVLNGPDGAAFKQTVRDFLLK
jgi:hypothetical protein